MKFAFLAILLVLGSVFALGGSSIIDPILGDGPAVEVGIIDPGMFLPSPYGVELMTTRTVNTNANTLITAKFTSTTNDQLVTHYDIPGATTTHVDVYGLSGSALSLAASKTYGYTSSNFDVSSAKGTTQGHIGIAGCYYYGPTYPYGVLGNIVYNGSSVVGPVTVMSSMQFPNTCFLDFDFGYMTGASDYFMITKKNTGSSSYINQIVVQPAYVPTTHYSYNLSMHYTQTGYYDLELGHFSSSSAKEGVFVGYGTSYTDLHQFAVEAGSLNRIGGLNNLRTQDGKRILVRKAVAADLDGDYRDELILVGLFDAGYNFAYYSDLIDVYKYNSASGNWQLKNEYLNASTGSSIGMFAGVTDVDSDGSKEIITVSETDYREGTNLLTRGQINVFKYNATNTKLTLVYKYLFEPAETTISDYFDVDDAVMADMNYDGKKELAILYFDKASASMRIALFKLGKDQTPPTLGIYKPTSNSTTAMGKMEVRFFVYDFNAVNPGSFRVKLTGPAGYDSGYATGGTNLGSGKSYNYIVNLSLSNLSAGNYTIRAEAADAAGNKAYATKNITLTSLSLTIPGGFRPLLPGGNTTNESSTPPLNESVVEESVPEPSAPETNVTESTPEDATPSTEIIEAPEETPVPETQNSQPGTSTEQPATSSQSPAPSSETQNTTPATQNSQPETNTSSSAANDSSASTTANRLISELEIKISVATQQGKDATSAKTALAQAKALADEGKSMDAALAAQSGITKIDETLNTKPQDQNTKPGTPDYTPYLLAGGAILVLGGAAYFLLGKKPPIASKHETQNTKLERVGINPQPEPPKPISKPE